MIQVVTAIRRVFVQCLFPKCVIDMRSLICFLPDGVRNVGHYLTGLPSGTYLALSTQTAGHPFKLGRHSQHDVDSTITLLTDDNKTIHLRATTQAEARQKQIYAALSIKPDPVGKCKAIIDKKKSVVPSEIK